ncbi:MAG: 30S ribosomal protein S1 [Acidobacteria bacterium]|nr:30S ribosomal protein S1 [Acidobacteriota bacterium]
MDLQKPLTPDPAQTQEEALAFDGSDQPSKPGAAEQPAEQEDFAAMLEQYDAAIGKIAEGEVVRGRVLKVLSNEVIVDVGYKSEGMIDISEFRDESGKLNVAAGDEIDVLLERTENRDGYVVLSREKAEKMKVWNQIEGAYREGRPIMGRVIERIKGGLAVDVGVRAFLPGSLVDMRPVRNLDAMRGKEFPMRVIKVNRRRGNIVLSRKAVLEEENSEKKQRTLENLQEGRTLNGIVKNITEYGAFVDLGGLDGLLHITDMSWGRLSHPSEMLSVGQELEIVVLKFDRERERVSLGLKQLTPDPWLKVPDSYPVGTRVKGKVVSLTDYGAFVELQPGVEGLIHVSEMSWSKRIKHPSKVVNPGDSVEAVVLDADVAARRLSLGLKQIEPNPWDAIAEKYPVGTHITGEVRNLTEFGAFIEVEEGIDGLVHISDLSWTKAVKHPSEVLKKGDSVEAIILKIDSENQRLSLGIKQLQPSHWDEFFNRARVGDLVKGKIARLAEFGVFIEIEEGVEGLCHVSELSEERIEHPQEKFSVGDEITAKIIRLDTTERKVALSVKALETDAERADLEQYLKQRDGGSASLGELVGEIPAESGTALYSSKEEEEAAAQDAGQLTGHKEEITEAESKPSEGEQGEPEGSSDPEGKES